ncbi:MAG: hypothetical protein ACE5GV_04715 [Candidatus Scalindua sp.]
MPTITKLYPLLKDIGLDDKKSQEFIEIIESSYHSEIEQEIKKLVTNETFLTETTKLREEMAILRGDMAILRGDMAKIREEIANMKVDLIKWSVGTIIAVAGVVAAITKLIG